MTLTNFRFLIFIFFSYAILINFLITLNEFTEYTNQTFNILITSICIFLLFIFLLDRIIILFKNLFNKLCKINIIQYHKIHFQFLFILLSSLAISSTINPHVAELHQTSNYNFIGNLIISFLISIFFIIKKNSIKHFIHISLFILITSVVFLSISILFKANNNEIFKSEVLTSKTLNVFVISFDSLSSNEMHKAIINTENKNAFKDFIFFNNVISKAPGSATSLAFDIIGNRKISEHQKFQQYLNKLIISESENLINKSDFNSETFGYFNMYKEKDRLIDFNSNSNKYFLVELNRFFEPSLQRFFTKESSNILKFFLKTNHLYLVESMNQYDVYVNKLKNSQIIDDVVVHMGHWSFSHYPNIHDRNCNLTPAYDITHRDEQRRYQNAELQLDESFCAALKYQEFIQVLKQKNIYKNSLIILKSDHGPPSHIYPMDDILSSTINNSVFGYSRHRPFLMIKPPFNKNDLVENNSLIFLSDIQAYICSTVSNLGLEDKYNCLDENNYLRQTIEDSKKIFSRKEQIFIDNGQNRYRLDENISVDLDINVDNYEEILSSLFNQNLNENLESCFIYNWQAKKHLDFKIDYDTCLKIDKTKKNILFFGDGLAREFGVLSHIFDEDFNFLFIFGNGCVARYWDEDYNDFDGDNCREMNKFAREFIDKNNEIISTVFLVNMKNQTTLNLKKLDNFKVPLIILGPLPKWKKDIRDIITLKELEDKNYRRPIVNLDTDFIDIVNSDKNMIRRLKESDFKNLKYISLIGDFCDDVSCQYKVPDKINSIFGVNPAEKILTDDGVFFIMNNYIKRNF